MKYEVEGLKDYTISNYEIKGNRIVVYFVDKRISSKVIKVNSKEEKIDVLNVIRAEMVKQLTTYVQDVNSKKIGSEEARDYVKYKFYLNNIALFNSKSKFKLCKIKHKFRRVKGISINEVDKYSLRKLRKIKSTVEANVEANEFVNEIVKRR